MTGVFLTRSISRNRPTSEGKTHMAGARGLALKRPSAIPGFGLALGFSLTYLSLIVLIPLAALAIKAASLGASGFWEIITAPRALAAFRVCVVVCFIAGVRNVVF